MSCNLKQQNCSEVLTSQQSSQYHMVQRNLSNKCTTNEKCFHLFMMQFICATHVPPMTVLFNESQIFILTGSYNPILKPPYKHWRCKPGTMPFHRADIPSSLAMVLTVPSKPLYLGKPTPSSIPTFFWS